MTTNTNPNESVSSWTRVEDFLRDRGADRMPHPGGTLLAHLSRVARLLDRWGADHDVQAAGLCHAAYGTDGFDESLVRTTDRATMSDLIGERAEGLVHLYGSCDRGAVYPQLGGGRPVVFRNRFTGGEHTASDADLRAFVEITAANELDVLAHNEDMAARYGAALYALFARSRDLLSAEAWAACTHQLGPDARP